VCTDAWIVGDGVLLKLQPATLCLSTDPEVCTTSAPKTFRTTAIRMLAVRLTHVPALARQVLGHTCVFRKAVLGISAVKFTYTNAVAR